jgi:hypothetical protein
MDMATAVGAILLLVHGSAMAGEVIKAEGPAAKRGWIVVVRPGYGDLSARLTDELKGEYGTRWFNAADGTRVSVLNNVRLVLSAPEWSVTASRVYLCASNLLTDLVYLDPPSADLSDEQAAALLLAYASFRWAEQTAGDAAYEPIVQGASKTNAELTIRLDDRTPTVLKGASIRVEQNSGRILVSRNVDAK